MAVICICSKSFSDEGALQRHQAKCRIYLSNISILSANLSATRKRRREISSELKSCRSRTADVAAEQEGPQIETVTEDFPTAQLAEPAPPAFSTHGRPIRSNRGALPQRYADFIPEGPAPLASVEETPDEPMSFPTVTSSPDEPSGPPVTSPSLKITRTKPNTFGLIREYIGNIPLRDPDDEVAIEDLVAPGPPARSASSSQTDSVNPYFPYPNKSAYLIDAWYWSQAQKSQEDFNRLTSIITDTNFDKEDIIGVPWSKLRSEMASSSSSHFDNREGWKDGHVVIKIPLGKRDLEPYEWKIGNVWHKSLVHVIRTRFESSASLRYHYVPYRLIWAPNALAPEQLLYGELYNSTAFIAAHQALQSSNGEEGCSLPRNIAALMFWSDATQLADFGTASLWPVYLQLGNESKYSRGQPSANAFSHLAYLPTLPKVINEIIRDANGKYPTKQLLTHCKRELFHAIWALLLDDEFCYAYVHGIVVLCGDGITRRLYPRIFTYSADYPEKVLLATIRDMGDCPCPRCLVSRKAISTEIGVPKSLEQRKLGMRTDNEELQALIASARKLIYEDGYVVNSTHVDAILKSQSLVPTQNAFSLRLGNLGFQFHKMLVPDMLHEWPLGVIKGSVTHLIRILYAHSKNVVLDFDHRFSLVPEFGRDTIRNFGDSVSEMTKFAARTFEDVLLCLLPVIEGLLPEPHNTIVQDWIFAMAYCHNLSKLRIHTPQTLDLLDSVTLEFGKLTRRFKDITCNTYHTTELPKEAAARVRRKSAHTSRAGVPASAANLPSVAMHSSTKKEFSISTYKFHSATNGDYTDSIKEFGTVDSYTSQLGEVHHRVSKSGQYGRTSKKNFEEQMAGMDMRDQRLARIAEVEGNLTKEKNLHQNREDDNEDRLTNDLTVHHVIGKDQKHYIDLPIWLRKHGADQATKDFVRKLKSHILYELDISSQPTAQKATYTEEELDCLIIRNDRIYEHQTLKINYTTYDVRRDQDLLKSKGPRKFIMMPSADHSTRGNHFLYAQILGIYHCNVIDARLSDSTPPVRVEFLFVRWLAEEPSWVGGWSSRRLYRVGFVPENDDHAFGFVNPANIIRAAHLIPTFTTGKTRSLLEYSRLARGDEEEDWEMFYVNWFVDRDMLMRFIGGAIGHRTYRPSLRDCYLPEEPIPVNVNTTSTALTAEISQTVESVADSVDSDSEINSDYDGEEELGPETVLESYSAL